MIVIYRHDKLQDDRMYVRMMVRADRLERHGVRLRGQRTGPSHRMTAALAEGYVSDVARTGRA